MSKQKVQVNVFQQAKKGEIHCGDSYFYTETEHEFICVLADGLGSGKYARESAEAVIHIIKNNLHLKEEQVIEKCVEQLQGKRGVVLGILKIDFLTKMYKYSSIGNIGLIIKQDNGQKKQHIPQHGFLSCANRPLKKVVNTLYPRTTLVLYSDGVSQSNLFQTFIPFDYGEDWIVAFPVEHLKNNDDDTTVIAMYYQGEHN